MPMNEAHGVLANRAGATLSRPAETGIASQLTAAVGRWHRRYCIRARIVGRRVFHRAADPSTPPIELMLI